MIEGGRIQSADDGRDHSLRSAARQARAEHFSGADVGRAVVPHNADTSVPSLDRLRGMALALIGRTRRTRRERDELRDDLLAEGWLAYVEHAARYPGSVAQRYYLRARGAMLDYLQATGLTGGAVERRAIELMPLSLDLEWCESASLRETPMRRLGIRRAERDSFLAFARRHLSFAEYQLLRGLLLEDESMELLAARFGISIGAAMVSRSRALAKLRARLAA